MVVDTERAIVTNVVPFSANSERRWLRTRTLSQYLMSSYHRYLVQSTRTVPVSDMLVRHSTTDRKIYTGTLASGEVMVSMTPFWLLVHLSSLVQWSGWWRCNLQPGECSDFRILGAACINSPRKTVAQSVYFPIRPPKRWRKDSCPRGRCRRVLVTMASESTNCL
ncbi:hypothetical protein F5141DRAFT_469535 [Pisolithus sp. B1]|nr:hypothetical protein F5141DRAFT_469535 [Pisolithus sp. B1]